MTDRRSATRATEVLAAHAHTGGYDMDNVYGKKKPSGSLGGGGGGGGGGSASSVEDSSGGPYSGAQYSSPYSKPAGQPTTEESSGYGKTHSYGESRPSGYGEEEEQVPSEGQYSSRPAHGRKPAHEEDYEAPEGRFGRPDQGRKPNYGQEYESSEGRFGEPDHGRKPNYGGEYESEGHAPLGGGSGGGRKPAAAAYGEDEEYRSRPSARPQAQYGGRAQDNDYSEGRIPEPRRPAWQQDSADSGYEGWGGGGRNRPESEFSEYGAPKPTYGGRPQSGFSDYEAPKPTYGGRPQSGFSDYEAPKPTYGGRPQSEFSEYGAPKPTYGRHQEAEEHGSGPFKHGKPHGDEGYRSKPPERFGRQSDEDRLASETGGLSLGEGRHTGRDEEGYKPNRHDGSDSDTENEYGNRHHKKHEERHHHKHEDDY